ncbi:hypothetical protein C0J52_27537, partial [Blattella germanica]
SHDSASYSISSSSAVAPDALPFVQRYLDLRLGTKPATRDAFIVHGQFGASVEQIFQEVNTFLADHDGEIVILDFQHFYSFSQETHSYLMSLIDSYFGNRLCPLSRIISHISLRWMREKGYQVIAIYRNDAALGIPTLWPSSRWPTPWPETTSITTMFMFLEEKMSVRPADAGFVTQCVLTPDVKFFLKNCFSTLEKKCAIPCNHAIIPWLQKQRPGSKGINVVICDFVKMEGINFCKTFNFEKKARNMNPNLTIGKDLENWMTNLPEKLRNISITHLAIPGSHDSATYSIKRFSAVSPDAPPFVRHLSKVFGLLVKCIVYKWSITQHSSIEDQLQQGIRYLDLRLATKSENRNAFIVHGMYGANVEEIFEAVNKFLANHNGEIVILDFQHFYSFTEAAHIHLIEKINSYYQKRLCPKSYDFSHVSLQWMNNKGYQIISIYRNKAASEISTLWPSQKWRTHWPDTTSLITLFKFLERKLATRPLNLGLVTQCVLTPDMKFVLKHCCSNLREKCSKPCNRAALPWFEKQRPGNDGVNVVICDFVTLSNFPFCRNIVQLNDKLLANELDATEIVD